ncbi:hypothetical protein NDU88_004176 [Pleurodeles waltl]|uniref:Retrotransposon gag domain-containing protein n=1 Tax=Pleurodeles waltl TaxID=8319 RepID=A0AAV7W8A5_PLEWA|nr:hypothetical protein NDU88_004176 [Pleurodeles waltl]
MKDLVDGRQKLVDLKDELTRAYREELVTLARTELMTRGPQVHQKYTQQMAKDLPAEHHWDTSRMSFTNEELQGWEDEKLYETLQNAILKLQNWDTLLQGLNTAQILQELEEQKKIVHQMPLREVPTATIGEEGQVTTYVYVPWLRSDLYAFTKDYPKLREEPQKWYTELNRIVAMGEFLWKDLNMLFNIIIPRDLSDDCKKVVQWPTEEPERGKGGAPGKAVEKARQRVIKYIKEKVPEEKTDWSKIIHAKQEKNESVTSYYDRLLQVYQQSSGMKNPLGEAMPAFVTNFVYGLQQPIQSHLQTSLMCWQQEPIDKVSATARRGFTTTAREGVEEEEGAGDEGKGYFSRPRQALPVSTATNKDTGKQIAHG